MIYDLFFVGLGKVDTARWTEFKNRFPEAQLLENVDSFSKIKRRALTKLFWIVWDDLQVVDEFDFSYRATKWDLEYTHVFKNGNHFNGVCLCPKSTAVSDRDFKFRFFSNKKEVDVLASHPLVSTNKFDIIFISYNEPNAEENWNNLVFRFPQAKRIDGVTGIHQAHIEAAKLASTDMFWVVDGDAQVLDTFAFDYPDPEKYTVHVWRSKNPLNGLEYGYGGVKLLPTEMTLEMDVNTADMTTSISKQFKSVFEVSNVTAFNTDPFNTWKSAFRECVKLSSQVIDRQDSSESTERLDVWCNVAQGDYANHAIEGAIAGRKYGEQNRGNLDALKKINDFEWLKEKFSGR